MSGQSGAAKIKRFNSDVGAKNVPQTVRICSICGRGGIIVNKNKKN